MIRLNFLITIIISGLLGFLPVVASDNISVNNDFSEYMIILKDKIQKNWNPPECLEKDGHALVKFSITRSGDVYSSEMLESSGDIVFDESAMEAIRKSSPFARFPASTSRGSLTIKYSFDTAVVNTGNMQIYLTEADKFYNIDNKLALHYITKAIDEVDGDSRAYFLYSRRSNIKKALGDIAGAKADFDESVRLKEKYDKKRILSSKVIAEMEKSPFSYFSLAHSYEIAGDYEHAIEAIDKAIELTELNNNYKRYKTDLINKQASL